MQSFNGATWPPGARCEFLGIAGVDFDGTLLFSSQHANGQPVVTAVSVIGSAQYQLFVNVRPPNAVPYALIMVNTALARMVSMITNNANPNASVTIQLSDTVEADTAPFTAFIFCVVPPASLPPF